MTISIKELTFKLTVLLALTAASRASEISYLDINFMRKSPSCYVFSFPKLTKTCRPNKPSQNLKFLAFKEDRSLCVCHTLDTYLEKLKPLQSEGDTQLLLSHIKSHNPVKTYTVSRWMMEFLKASGIDTKYFSGHSTRYASTSNAKALGIPIVEIVNRVHWSSDSMFKKRYCVEVVSDSNFQKTLFLRKL